MAEWIGRCSPLGKVWAVEMKPGSDTDFQEVWPLSDCKRPKKDNGFVRELDIIFPLEEYYYSSKVEFPSETGVVLAEAPLSAILPKEDTISSLVEFEKVLVDKNILTEISLQTGIDIASVRELSRQDFVKSVDSVLVSLYTEEKDGVNILSSFWVVGTKDIDEAVKVASKIELEGTHEIILQDTVLGKDLLVLRVNTPLSDELIASEGIKISSKKNIVTTCSIGETVLYGVGWALQGYGLGGYGL